MSGHPRQRRALARRPKACSNAGRAPSAVAEYRANCSITIGVVALLLLSCSPLKADAPKLVATIKPLHSLLANVTRGVVAPTLLMSGSTTPHAFALRPSQARALERADLVVWVGPVLEASLTRFVRGLPRTRSLAALEIPAIERLKPRSSGPWHVGDAHEHGDAQRRDGHQLAHDVVDPHLWLSPHNAHVLVAAIATKLSAIDPKHASIYQRNASQAIERIAALDEALSQRLAPVRQRPFVVFHDAYQYFERQYQLLGVGALAVNPERRPGAQRIRAIRKTLNTRGVKCVFSEPQYEPKLVHTVIEGTQARSAVLDPLGARHSPGPDAWFELMQDLGNALRQCLGS